MKCPVYFSFTKEGIKQIPKTSGIYIIENKVTNEIYVGQTINFKSRIRNHFDMLHNHNHSNKRLQSAFNDDCCFSVILKEIIPQGNSSKHSFSNILDSREAFWMNKLLPKYNIITPFASRKKPSPYTSNTSFTEEPEIMSILEKIALREGKSRVYFYRMAVRHLLKEKYPREYQKYISKVKNNTSSEIY